MNPDALIESLSELGMSAKDCRRIRDALILLSFVDGDKLETASLAVETKYDTLVAALLTLREGLEKT